MDVVDLTRPTGNNDGGFKSILSYIPASDIGTWPGPKANPTVPADHVKMETGDIIAKVGKRWGFIELNIEKLGNTFTAEGNAGSLTPVNNPVITLDDLTDVEWGWLIENLNKPMVYVLKDMANRFICYGDPEMPAYITSAEGGNGTAVGDDKSMTITIRSIPPPKFYEGTISYAVVV